jgi:hypothetical protein
MMRRAWPAACLALVLAGCTVAHAPAPGLTADEKDFIRHQYAEALWAATGLYADQRPANPSVTVVSLVDWSSAFAKCMNNAGFERYTVSPDGNLMILDHGTGDEGSEAERLADYLCRMSFELEEQFDYRYSDAQIEYLYDYYREALVPCLAAEGFTVSAVPTRNEFEHGLGSWHPYLALSDELRLDLLSDRSFLVRCPPMPPGVTDPGYAAYFDY